MTTLRFVEQTGMFKDMCAIAQYGVRIDHCDAVSNEGTYIGAHLLGGVQELKPGYDNGQIRQEIFVRLNMTEEQEDRFFARLRSHVGQPYDPIAVLYFWGPFADRNWHDPGAWECTSFVVDGLIYCGWLPENKMVPAGRLTPRDLYYLTSTLEAMANGGADG